MTTVLFYRNDLLPPSETFIYAQATSLLRYKPHFVGLRAVPAGLLDSAQCSVAARTSRLPRALQKLAASQFGLHPAMQRAEFLQRLRALAPVLMHVQFATDALTALPLAMHLNIPMIVSMHGYDVTVSHEGRNPFRNALLRHRRHALQRYASRFLCISNFIREKALKLNYPSEKMLVHPLGIDTDLFRQKAACVNNHSIVFVARLTEKKGCEYLIRAMQLVQRSVPNATLTIIGEGPLRTGLQLLARQLDAHCNFLGRQDYNCVRQHMAAARVFCVPSIVADNGDSEGLGMVFAEAQALGVPVCSTLHGGIPEVVLHRRTGLLCPERNVEALAANLVHLLTDDAMHAAFSRCGRAFIEQHYDLRQRGLVLEELYDEVLATPTQALVSRYCATATAMPR